MAYTYKDFLTKATQDGKLGEYDQEQLSVIQQNPAYGLGTLAVKKEMDAAQTPQQKMLAQHTMDQLKGAYKPAQMMTVGTPFHWGGEEQFNGLIDKVVSRPEFQYDAARDPAFSEYRKSMIREGNRAQRNTLTQTAAMTGGDPSSYAVTAAAQAGNYNASKIGDALPNFRQRAMEKWLKDRQMDLNALEVLKGERQNAYQMYLQNYQNALRAYQMGEWTPEIADILGLTWYDPEDVAPDVIYVGGGGGKKTNPDAGDPTKDDTTPFIGRPGAAYKPPVAPDYYIDRPDKRPDRKPVNLWR